MIGANAPDGPGARSPGPARWRGWITALVFLAFATNAVDWAITKREPGIDFSIYQRAAQRFVAGEDLYPASDGQSAYKYAPAFATVFLPFAPLPLRTAWAAFNLVSAACLAWIVRWSTRRMAPRASWVGHAVLVLAVYPVAVQLFRIGQVDAWLVALVVASEALAARWPVASGLLWATATVAKTPFLILLLPAIAQRSWRRILAGGVGLVAWLGAGLLLRGPSRGLADLAAWRALLATSTPPLFCYGENQSLVSIVCRYVGEPAALGWRFEAAVAAADVVALLCAGAAVVVATRRDARAGADLAFAVALALAFFLSPLGWRSNLVLLIPLLALALGTAIAARAAAARALGAAALAVLLVVKYVVPAFLRVSETAWLLVRADGLAFLAAAALATVAVLWEAIAGGRGDAVATAADAASRPGA